MATVSFLASRAIPAGGFLIALAGGVALARAGQQAGSRRGYGASIAAVLETTATMGPARFNVPVTQALTAPLLGRLEARGTRAPAQVAVCALIRLLHNAAVSAFFVVVIAGGVEDYAAAFRAFVGWIAPLPPGPGVALGALGVGLLAWSAFASIVQVAVYRRGLADWSAAGDETASEAVEGQHDSPPAATRRFDPRAVTGATALALGVLLSGTSPIPLALVAGWLAAGFLIARVDLEPLAIGMTLAVVLGLGALAVGVLGGVGLDAALRRGLRAGLLVVAATWLRAGAGDAGLREVFRRALGRLRLLPAVPEAIEVLDGLGSQRRVVRSAQVLGERLRAVPRRPGALLAATLRWVAGESRRRAVLHAPAFVLRARPRDGLLVASAALPALGLLF
ncbi:MAG: hypothetical protein ACR2LY_01675 [Thermoleophilaceae bacterium]